MLVELDKTNQAPLAYAQDLGLKLPSLSAQLERAQLKLQVFQALQCYPVDKAIDGSEVLRFLCAQLNQQHIAGEFVDAGVALLTYLDQNPQAMNLLTIQAVLVQDVVELQALFAQFEKLPKVTQAMPFFTVLEGLTATWATRYAAGASVSIASTGQTVINKATAPSQALGQAEQSAISATSACDAQQRANSKSQEKTILTWLYTWGFSSSADHSTTDEKKQIEMRDYLANAPVPGIPLEYQVYFS